jgi:cytochrome c oxidase subunit 3
MSASWGYAADDARLAVRSKALVFGVVLFLGSELMLFAAWFAAYFDLRGVNSVWPPSDVHLDPLEPSIGTVLLAMSSGFFFPAVAAIRKGQPNAARAWLAGGLFGAVGFIALTLHGWSKDAFRWYSHAYGSVYYGMLGFHVAHVAVGVILMLYLVFGASKAAFRGAHAAGTEAISYYWHFVFIVWLGIWSTIFFVR